MSLATPILTDSADDRDTLYAQYLQASAPLKVVMATRIVQSLRGSGAPALESALDQTMALIAMIDRDHVEDLDLQIASLWRSARPG